MQQWRIRVFIAVAMAVSLSPLAICLPLWKHLLHQKLSAWRRKFSFAGLSLATLSAFVSPVWILIMLLLSHNGENSGVLEVGIDLVLVGMAAALLAFLLLCFAKERVRRMGLTACALTMFLFALSFSGFGLP